MHRSLLFHQKKQVINAIKSIFTYLHHWYFHGRPLDVCARPLVPDEVPDLLGVHLAEFVEGEVAVLELGEDVLPEKNGAILFIVIYCSATNSFSLSMTVHSLHVRVLLERALKIPDLPLQRLGELEHPPGKQWPVPPQDDLKQRPGKRGKVA